MLNLQSTYDISAMIKKYPRATARLGEWYYRQWENSQKAIGLSAGVPVEDTIKALEGAREQILDSLSMFFTYNARDLYDFFDAEGIPLGLIGGGKIPFMIFVGEKDYDLTFTERFEAEKKAFTIAFELLEAKP